MPMFAWVKNAYIDGNFFLDHTWVTSYDIRQFPYPNVGQVIAANEIYWYCKGDFWYQTRLEDPIVVGTPTSGAASCLVIPNDRHGSGTVHVYGLDGVCHQVANQVLYVTGEMGDSRPFTVKMARGYLLSTILYGTYGRREAEWDQTRIRCGVKLANAGRRRGITSLFSRRMAYCLNVPTGNDIVVFMEQQRRALLIELDNIGYRRKLPNETAEQRVAELNAAINSFLREAEQTLPNDDHVFRVLGIRRNEEAFVIDPALFEFPNPEDRPARNSALGW